MEMAEDTIELDVVRFYTFDELDFLLQDKRFFQAVVKLTQDSFDKIMKIAPYKEVRRKLMNSIIINISSDDIIIPTG